MTMQPRKHEGDRPRRWWRVATAALIVGGVAAGTAAAADAPSKLTLGPATTVSQRAFQGYYDGHKDTYLFTDVSSKGQAEGMKINYAPVLGAVKNQPEMYFVQGRAAKGQLAVFGSEPGEKSYSPLWTEVIVTWKSGQKPVLLVKDDQINGLAKKGMLTMKTTTVINNAPITKVGKGG